MTSRFNIFDGFVVLMSFVDITLTAVIGSSAGGLSALRTFRLARIFKLAKSWKDLRKLLATIILSISNVSNAVVVLMIILFIFTLLGMQLLGGQCVRQRRSPPARSHLADPLTRPCASAASPRRYDGVVASGYLPEKPRANYDTFWWAFVTVFQVVSGENWNQVLAEGYSAIGISAVLYLFAVNIIGSYVFLNLFLAILLGAFESSMEADKLEGACARVAGARSVLQCAEDTRASVPHTSPPAPRHTFADGAVARRAV